MLRAKRQDDPTKREESTDEKEQALSLNICGTSGVQATREAEEVSGELDQMIDEGGKEYSPATIIEKLRASSGITNRNMQCCYACR
jgi:hypothetical protein